MGSIPQAPHWGICDAQFLAGFQLMVHMPFPHTDSAPVRLVLFFASFSERLLPGLMEELQFVLFVSFVLSIAGYHEIALPESCPYYMVLINAAYMCNYAAGLLLLRICPPEKIKSEPCQAWI